MQRISVWNDRWLPFPYNFKPFSLPVVGTEDLTVEHLIDHNSKEWLDLAVNELLRQLKHS